MLKSKVLIIDDEVDFCMIMENYFSKKNYDVFLAYTLRDGLKLVNEVKPEILFLDNNLSDGQGWEHADEIVEKIPQIKIYLISAYRQKKDFSNPLPNAVVWEKPISLGLLNSQF
jgi:DNA-binding response OmpR family regulator